MNLQWTGLEITHVTQIILVNQGSTPCTYQFRAAGTAGAWGSAIPQDTPVTGSAPLLFHKLRAGGYTGTGNAGASRYQSIVSYVRSNSANTGLYNFSWSVDIRAEYLTPSLTYKVKTVTFTKQGVMNVPAPNSFIIPNPMVWGTVTFTNEPASGIVSFAATRTMAATLKIGTSTIAFNTVAGQTAQWTTANPENYVDGTTVRINYGPVILGSATITKDGNGNFNIHFIQDMGGDDPSPDGEDSVDYVPPSTWAENNADLLQDASGSQTSVGGKELPAMVGTDPSAAAPGSAQNDMYQAMRAGMRDAMNEDVNTGDAPDFSVPDDVRGIELGKGIVAAMGTGFTVPALAKPTVTSSNLVVSFYGIPSTIPAPAFLLSMRPWFEFLLHILGVMGLVKMTKVALA